MVSTRSLILAWQIENIIYLDLLLSIAAIYYIVQNHNHFNKSQNFKKLNIDDIIQYIIQYINFIM